MLKCIAVLCVGYLVTVCCEPRHEYTREKRSTEYEFSSVTDADTRKHSTSKSFNNNTTTLVHQTKNEFKDLSNKELPSLSPVNDSPSFRNLPNAHTLNLIKLPCNYRIQCLQGRYLSLSRYKPDERMIRHSYYYDRSNYSYDDGYSQPYDDRPPPPPPRDHRYPPHDRGPPPPPPPPDDYRHPLHDKGPPPPPPPEDDWYPPYERGPPPPPPPPPSYDHRPGYNNYYHRPPPTPAKNARSRSYEDERPTRQSSYYDSPRDRRPPPPPPFNRGGPPPPPPYHRGPPPRPDEFQSHNGGPPPHDYEPPPKRGRPPPNRGEPPPNRGGPPPNHGRPPPNHGDPRPQRDEPPPGSRPSPYRNQPPPPSYPDKQPSRYNDPPYEQWFESDAPRQANRPSPYDRLYDNRSPNESGRPPFDGNVQATTSQTQSYDRQSDTTTKQQQQFSDNSKSSKIVNSETNSPNSAFQLSSDDSNNESENDDQYLLDVRFADDTPDQTSMTAKIKKSNTVTTTSRPLPLVPYLYQAPAVTPEN